MNTYCKLSSKLLFRALILCSLAFPGLSRADMKAPPSSGPFIFDVTCDMRDFAGPGHDTSEYFRGVCEAIRQAGPGAFMLSPGDIDPPGNVYATIRDVLGDSYPWFPSAGNHETETPEDMVWVRKYNEGGKSLPWILRGGPEGALETCYSFDYSNAHFVVLNEYFATNSDTATDGDVPDELYAWLDNDLKQNTKPLVVVSGHEPFLPAPDEDSGRLRHEEDSLNKHPGNCQRFVELLERYNVAAYICGHTHNSSLVNLNGVWQLDAGHARGKGDPGAPSTFLRVKVNGDKPPVAEQWRADPDGRNYRLTRTWTLYRCQAVAR